MAVEVVISLVPVAAADSVIARRVLLWAALGTLISVATHGLRDRIAHSQRESARLQEQLREMTVQQDRDRIAAGLQDEVIQRIFAAGLALQSAASLSTQPACGGGSKAPPVTWIRCCGCCGTRCSAWKSDCTTAGCAGKSWNCAADLSPAPEVSFSGPVDGALQPGMGTGLVQLLREALVEIGPDAVPASIGVTADEEACLTVIEATARPHAADLDWAARKPAGWWRRPQRPGPAST